MPVLQAPIVRVAEYAQWAQDAGMDSAWDHEFFKNPFVTLAGAAAATDRITLGTAIAQAFGRTPFEVANASADIDEISGGRAILGLGTGAPDFMAALHGDDFTQIVPRMREYVAAVRWSWRYLASGDGEALAGAHFPMAPLPMNPWGGREMARTRIPIHLAAMRPRMMQLAGEVADAMLALLQTPEYIAEVARPAIAIGAERGGRDVAEVEVTSMVVCSVSDDRDEAWRRARLQVGLYVAFPVGDEIVRFHGFERQQAAIQRALMTAGPAALAEVVDDELIETFCICGTPDEARAQLSRYEAIDRMILHTPYVPLLTFEETEDSYRAILRTFGGSSAT